MKPREATDRQAVLTKLAEIQPATLKELTAALDEDYTFIVRTMKKYRKAKAAHIGNHELHCSKWVALWVVGAGEDAKPPKARSRSQAYLRTYHREYYHRRRKQRMQAANSPTYNTTLSALLGIGRKAA